MHRFECDGCGKVERTHNVGPANKVQGAMVRIECSAGQTTLDRHLCGDCASRLMAVADPAKWPRAEAEAS
jgi:hypothetical protein